MFELVGLNGARILVNAKSVFRIRPSNAVEDRDVAKVEYGGGYIYTREAIDGLLARLAGAEVRIVRLTSRTGTPVYLNVASISRVREALPINGPGTEVAVGGQFQHVTETLDEVVALIAA